MKKRHGFANSFTILFDYVMDSRNSESEGICQGCTRRTRWQKPAITRSENTFPYFLFYRQKCEEQM